MKYRLIIAFRSRDQGFALLSVLLIIAIISTSAITMLLRSRDDLREMTLVERSLRSKIHADNAIVRAIAALSNPLDPLHAALLMPGKITRWRDEKTDIDILVEHESGKIDLNHADSRLINSAIARLGLASSEASALEQRIEVFRRTESFIRDFRQILTPAQILSQTGSRAERLFTMATGARGVVLSAMPPENFVILPNLSQSEFVELQARTESPTSSAILARYRDMTSPWRPVFTIRTRVVDIVLPPLKRKAGVVFRQIPARWREEIDLLFWEHDNWPWD